MQSPEVRGCVCSDSYPARTKYIMHSSSLIHCVRSAHAHRVNDNNPHVSTVLEFLLSFNSDMYVVQVEPVQSSW